MEELFMKRKMALMLSLCMMIAGAGSAYMVKAATIVPTIEPKQATTIQPLNTLTPSEQQELANAKPNLMPGIITETPNATPYLALETPIPFIRSEQPSHVLFLFFPNHGQKLHVMAVLIL